MCTSKGIEAGTLSSAQLHLGSAVSVFKQGLLNKLNVHLRLYVFYDAPYVTRTELVRARLNPFPKQGIPLVCASKGIEAETLKATPQYTAGHITNLIVVYLSILVDI